MRSPVATVTGALLAEDRVVLPPDPRSASAARRFVRQALAQADRDEWADAAELAVSEIVSNAVLHAHTDVEVAVSVRADAVRVDVLDHSPLLPAQRSYGEHATTGRGLGLVAVLADRFGVEPHEGDGKTVWFCLSGTGAEDEPDLDAWDDDAWDVPTVRDGAAEGAAARDAAPAGSAVDGAGLPGDGLRVELRGLPVSLWLAAQQHHDALIREYVLALTGGSRPTDDGAVTATVLAADRAQGLLAAAVEHVLEEALAVGVPTVPLPSGHPSPLPEVPPVLDVVVTVGPDDAPAFAALQDALDSAERLARQGLLLARPALPEVVAVRDWACEQAIAQSGGVEPSPYPGVDSDHVRTPAPTDDGLPLPEWDAGLVWESDRGVVAADESNRILAVSEPLARATGWDRAELAGRRVVALIPPRLRELHVAGFTRHLTTGESHVLGVPLELPVLHRDGHEVTCRFLVERVADTGPRAVYLAWIEPIETAPTDH